MLDHVVTDIELKNAVLCELHQPRPAYVAAASADGEEHHFWHPATGSAVIGGTLSGVDIHITSGFWVPIMPLVLGGAVSTAIASGLKPDSVRQFAQTFTSTGGITHRQHRERNVQLPPRRTVMRGWQ